MLKRTLVKRNDAQVEFELETPDINTSYNFISENNNDDDNGGGDNKGKGKSSMSVAELQLWYIKGIFWMVFVIGSLLVAGAIALIVLASVIASSEQAHRAMHAMDSVFEMRDYTKTMTDMTVGSQKSIEEAIKQYRVHDMVQSIQNMVSKGDALMTHVKPETLQQASTQLSNVMQRIDLEQGALLMQNLNNWSAAIDPSRLRQDIVDPMHTFLTTTNSVLQRVQEENVLKHVADVASATLDLEARLQRLNEITIRIPSK